MSSILNNKLLLDLSPIKSGGGAQLALNFIQYVSQPCASFEIHTVLVSDRFPFLESLKGNYKLVIAPSESAARFLFENTKLRQYVKKNNITHTFTFFGPGLPTFKRVRQVVGVAYPILVYDDSSFWYHLPFKAKLVKRFQNLFRKIRLRKADHLIFETEVMRQRAMDSGLICNESSVLAPSPTSFLRHSPIPAYTGILRILFLAGMAPHKNLWRLPEVLPKLQKMDLNVEFFLSATKEQFIKHCPYPIPHSSLKLIDKYFCFLGHIPQNMIQTVYDQCSVVGNISDLESFSNNYMEAWLSGRPILASDRDFAREICGSTAIYVEPHDPESILQGLMQLQQILNNINELNNEFQTRLAVLPSLPQRIEVISSIIFSKHVSNN